MRPNPKSRAVVALVLAMGASGGAAACRGGVSEDPPINLAPDMDQQNHRRPQSTSKVFADGRAMRAPVEHTVAQGHMKVDTRITRGVDAKGNKIKRIPLRIFQTEAECLTQDPKHETCTSLDRGEERYNIYCSVCHDKAGSGNGAVPRRLTGTTDESVFSGIPAYWSKPELLEAPDGDFFHTISEGKGRMPGYASQIPTQDRWAIIAWVRVLQEIGGPSTGGAK